MCWRIYNNSHCIFLLATLFCVAISNSSSATGGEDTTTNDQIKTNDIDSFLDNETGKDEDNVVKTFRLLKYRDVYTLAKKRLHNPTTLQDLAKKLKKMDKAEMMYKQQRDTGDPEYDVRAERTIQDMLPEILHQYGVLDVDESWRSKPMHFEDVRLQKAWQQAMEQGNYNGEELRDLHTKLHTMQKRLGEYIWTLRQIEAAKERLNNETGNSINDEITDNSVDGSSDGSSSDDGTQPSRDSLIKLQAKMKNEFRNIDSDVLVLTNQVKRRAREDKLGEITDNRVKELLEKAREIMLDVDLQKFKSELDHFQNRITKLNHWQHTMDNLRKQLDANDHEKELMDEYAFSKAKVKELTKFVKKYHSTLYGRLYKNYRGEL